MTVGGFENRSSSASANAAMQIRKRYFNLDPTFKKKNMTNCRSG